MSKYTFSLETNFSGNINISQLHKEIENNTAIIKEFIGISQNNDLVEINFIESLSQEEETELNTIISNHQPIVEITYNQSIIIPFKKEVINNSTYTKAASFIYSGSNNIGPILLIKIISYMINCTSYEVKILNKTHNLIISENSFTNTSQKINNLTPLSNIPTSEVIIECYIKITSNNNGSVYLDNLIYMI